MLTDHLKRLNDIIDPEHAAQAGARTLAATSFEPVDRLPLLIAAPCVGWPTFTYREGFSDPEKMMLNELASAWVAAQVRDDRSYMIRANYGVGIIPSMFGCEVSLTGDSNMPWVYPLSDDGLDRVLDAGPVNIDSGLAPRVYETERFYAGILKEYENLAKCVHIYVCDTQGPFDIAHLVMGHRIYTELYDNPERVHRLLELTSDAYVRFTRAQKELIGEGYDASYHSGILFRGAVRVCNDTGINISAALYRQFAKPYDERVLTELGGGWVHYCGSGKQIMSEVLSERAITGINFGNSNMQDVDAVLREAYPRKVALLGWPREYGVPEWVKTGITLWDSAPDIAAAAAMMMTR